MKILSRIAIYCPVLLVFVIFFCFILYINFPEFYLKIYEPLNILFGNSFITCVLLWFLSFRYKACLFSKVSLVGLSLLAIFNLIDSLFKFEIGYFVFINVLISSLTLMLTLIVSKSKI